MCCKGPISSCSVLTAGWTVREKQWDRLLSVVPVTRQLPHRIVGKFVLRHSCQDSGGCTGETRLTHQTHPRLKGGWRLDWHLRRWRRESLYYMTSFNRMDRKWKCVVLCRLTSTAWDHLEPQFYQICDRFYNLKWTAWRTDRAGRESASWHNTTFSCTQTNIRLFNHFWYLALEHC